MKGITRTASQFVCTRQSVAVLFLILLISVTSCQRSGGSPLAEGNSSAEKNRSTDGNQAPEANKSPEPTKPANAADVARGSTADGVSLELPSLVLASYPMEVKIAGPIRGDGHQLMTVPTGKDQKARATNPGSVFNLRGGETSVALNAPYPPGDYELLYVSPGRRATLLSVPFRVVAPKAEITAPETAEAGKDVEVRVVGEVSPNTKVMIVPMDSPPTLVGDHVFLKGRGKDSSAIPALDGSSKDHLEVVRVPLRHAKPGKYEIQYVTSTSHVVYARRPLTIK